MNLKYCFLQLILIIAINLNSLVNCQSIELLKVESDIINGLEKYINDYESHINKLKSNLEELQKEHDEANEDVTRYLSNPINAYLLTKRLTTDWKHVETLISGDQNMEFFKNITSNFGQENLPNEEDLRNEILRLDRLRKTYDLPITEVANGYLDDVKYSDPLKSVDCFEIGRQLHLADEFESAIEWLQLSLKMFDYADFKNHEDADFAKASILDFSSVAQYEIGNYETALNLAGEAIKLYPEFDHIRDNIRKFRRTISEEHPKTTAGTIPKKKTIMNPHKTEYGKGCRGVLLKSSTELKELYCENYFGTFSTTFLKLAPLKIEVFNLKPKIFMIYDVVLDHDIERVVNMTDGKMTTANLLDQYKGIDVAYPTRSSQFYKIESDDFSLIDNINQKLSDATGLNVQSDADQLQLSVYNVGGHYTPKTLETMYKVDDKPVDNTEEFGNRVASVRIYLTDVEKGGATIFPKVKTVVFPKKGAALIWYNTLRNGKTDIDVQHACCPVLKGSKWLVSKWIRENDQMLIKSCGLNENDRYE